MERSQRHDEWISSDYVRSFYWEKGIAFTDYEWACIRWNQAIPRAKKLEDLRALARETADEELKMAVKNRLVYEIELERCFASAEIAFGYGRKDKEHRPFVVEKQLVVTEQVRNAVARDQTAVTNAKLRATKSVYRVREGWKMALFAMGDFHLSFLADKSQERFGSRWKNYVERIEQNCNQMVKATDTFVITGDHSWGRTLEECRLDLEFIESLPGRKILLRGNHDRFWDANKTCRLNEIFSGRLEFLQNNFYAYEEYALVGTKGICYEGEGSWEHFIKLRERELARLKKSFEAARQEGYQKYIMFLHYPPTSAREQDSPFVEIAHEYGVSKVVYSHCHGKERYDDSLKGYVEGIEYKLVSSDYLEFRPERIL